MIAYLSHSLGSANGEATIKRHDDIANAVGWLAFLMEFTDWNVSMPWFANVVALHGHVQTVAKERQFALLSRFDAVVFVGGVMSPRMIEERAEAARLRIAVIDLTDLGYYPPAPDRSVCDALDDRARAALALARR